ncbi:hypothetical protein, partial [Psychrobacter immobilis]|uniref:hypothetical protein n=1 Tax=Psychrobacter immobilis TaxID=498 RepID=UPI00191861CE
MVASKKGLITFSLITASLLSTTVGLTACERLPSVNADSTREKVKVQQPLVIDSKLPTATTVIDCTQLTPKQTVVIKGHSALSNSCDLTGKSLRFELNESNSSLDCRGARLSTMADDPSKVSAITIKPKTDRA